MPSPMAGERLVEVRAAGVNPVDWKIRSGMYGSPRPNELPAVLGSEVSGVVRQVGQDVDGFAVGDEMFGSVAPGSGGYAEYTLVTACAAAHKPPQVSFTDAATLVVCGRNRLRRRDPAGTEARSDAAHQRCQRRGGRGCCADRTKPPHHRHRTASADKGPLVESLGATLLP